MISILMKRLSRSKGAVFKWYSTQNSILDLDRRVQTYYVVYTCESYEERLKVVKCIILFRYELWLSNKFLILSQNRFVIVTDDTEKQICVLLNNSQEKSKNLFWIFYIFQYLPILFIYFLFLLSFFQLPLASFAINTELVQGKNKSLLETL